MAYNRTNLSQKVKILRVLHIIRIPTVIYQNVHSETLVHPTNNIAITMGNMQAIISPICHATMLIVVCTILTVMVSDRWARSRVGFEKIFEDCCE